MDVKKTSNVLIAAAVAFTMALGVVAVACLAASRAGVHESPKLYILHSRVHIMRGALPPARPKKPFGPPRAGR